MAHPKLDSPLGPYLTGRDSSVGKASGSRRNSVSLKSVEVQTLCSPTALLHYYYICVIQSHCV